MWSEKSHSKWASWCTGTFHCILVVGHWGNYIPSLGSRGYFSLEFIYTFCSIDSCSLEVKIFVLARVSRLRWNAILSGVILFPSYCMCVVSTKYGIMWFLLQLNSPDLFDMYSAGVVLLQMALPSLRSPAAIKNFKLEIKACQYDLNKWRAYTRLRPDFEILDCDSGRGWDLATKLICERGPFRRGRLSAADALRHPYFLLGGDQAAAVLSKLSLSRKWDGWWCEYIYIPIFIIFVRKINLFVIIVLTQCNSVLKH